MVAQAHHPAAKAPSAPEGHPVAKAAVEKKVEEKKGAYPAQWRADMDGPIVAPLITAGTYNIQQYIYLQFPLSSVLLTTTTTVVANNDATYLAWVAVPNTTGPIQSVARPPGS